MIDGGNYNYIISTIRPTVDKSGEESVVVDVVIGSIAFVYLFEPAIARPAGPAGPLKTRNIDQVH
jgi:hypothetical protein